ncbi:hypothetical protein KQI63_14060 [bacterium]|nr:hypothetical protein [bacterium]
MKWYRLPTALFLALLITASAFAVEPFMPREPAVSPDGSTVVFSFQGDLWSVSSEGGQATRLTANPAYDTQPVFSPDGSKIAFASDRFGDDDVFVMPAAGGPPSRLTHASTTDVPGGFSPDGSMFYFAASRPFMFPMDRQIQAVPTTGGTAFRLGDFWGDEVTVGADGTFIIAFGRVKAARIHYRGSYQREIFSYTAGNDPVQLTDNLGYDMNPMVAPDGTIYWLSDQDESMTQNVWKMNADGSGKSQVTFFEGDAVRSAALSADGTTLVLEQGTSIYTCPATDGSNPTKLMIYVAADQITKPVTIENKTGGADELAVSSDGEEYAMIVEGEIVLVNKDLGGRATVAVPNASREQNVEWRPGSTDTLAFVSDRFNYKTLCLLLSDDPDESNLRLARKHKIVNLTDGKQSATSPKWSPKGDKIAYIKGNADLHVMDADGKGDKAILTGWATPDFSWSPDGQWMAYAVEDRNFNADIWIMSADGKGEAVNVSQHPDMDMNPVWSPDGRMLAWNTARHANQMDIYFVYLTREDDERTQEEWEIWEKTRDKKKDKGDDEDEEEGEDELVVTIDFEDIHLRGRRMTSLPSDETMIAIHPKGDKLFFLATVEGDRDLYSVNRFGDDMEEVTSGGTRPSAITFDAANETFYYLKSGKPYSMGMDGGKSESTDFKARITIDVPGRRLQVLDEGWRVLGDWFYDPGMHGVDWPALRGKYANWASQVGHERDFRDVVNFMIGEVNASHMGYYPDRDSDNGPAPDGYLGLEFDPSYKGDGLKVKSVIPHSPADRVATRILPGDIILTIDGRSVSATQNYFATLETRDDIPTEVTLRRGKKEMMYEITPVGYRDLVDLLYANMEKTKRAVVEDASEGNVGYLHIRGMGLAEVERFEMNLYAAADDKDALIIDVRDNGGGWTTDMLLTILTQPVHAYTVARDGVVGYPQPRYPLYRWEKPIAVICNEGSYSNAEIFSHAIQTIGRGPVIGNTTGGNVISTGGWTTLDGAHIRMPFRGWYVWGGTDTPTPERNNLNEEGNGCVPDYLVPYTQADWNNGRDPQLDKATELMIEAAAAEAAKPKPSPKLDNMNLWEGK